ncbi:MAG: SemiSWEET transporter [Alcaligenaceae bacterium]|jgi:MtN3 and saliva related transmembrane protein|nr:SemiSWEET transporter [Alcaligenaceae bacterium]
MHIEIMGYIAAFLTTAAFFPQTYQTIKTRDTKAISLAMYVLFTLGIALWLAYGILIESLPLIFANTITFVMAGTILVLKLKER